MLGISRALPNALSHCKYDRVGIVQALVWDVLGSDSTLPLVSKVSLGQLLNLSVLQFSHL